MEVDPPVFVKESGLPTFTGHGGKTSKSSKKNRGQDRWISMQVSNAVMLG